MRSPQLDDHLRQQINAGIEGHKDQLLATTNPAELKTQLRDIALDAIQQSRSTVQAASGGTAGDRS
jgi:hypothetical protein